MDLNPQTDNAATVLPLSLEQRLRQFMQAVSGRALVMMENACNGRHDIASDLLQEAFIAIHQHYPDKPMDEWYPLFYTILNNKLNDWRRKEARRQHRFGWLRLYDQNDDEDDAHGIHIDHLVDQQQTEPSLDLIQQLTLSEIQQAIRALPLRQQQAFMLRAWEGFDTATTAQVMNCSIGSVKTHYHRAILTLKTHLAHLNEHDYNHHNINNNDEVK